LFFLGREKYDFVIYSLWASSHGAAKSFPGLIGDSPKRRIQAAGTGKGRFVEPVVEKFFPRRQSD
jgi:hypothetical protein